MITPENGSDFIGLQEEVALSCSEEGAQIFYTVDGSDPVTHGLLYALPIKIHGTTTIKAMAVKKRLA